jgi:tetratricopeptide (TPR) repeat protein
MGERKQGQRATFTFHPNPAGTTPGQRSLAGLINDFEQASADSDQAAMAALKARIRADLIAFRESSGDGHSNPDWVIPVMEANALSSFGDLNGAISLELRGLKHAHAPQQIGISHMNLSDHFRRLGRLEEALEHAFAAHETTPNEGAALNLAMALYKLGKKKAAGKVIEEIAKVSSPTNATSFMSAALLFEADLREMSDVPQVKQLLAVIETHREL